MSNHSMRWLDLRFAETEAMISKFQAWALSKPTIDSFA